ncbi:GDSL esterase/lipase [Hibiscus syriacus]|uniref:GDSL esterase/lipase n=1 Tax=Hibiscus syriacus TaxID=106335 RepID=A0A6A3ACE0_HIBSY|nr:GDSL esterase/lipase [Hibiscus syriacus]
MSSPMFFVNLVTVIAIMVSPAQLAEARAFFVFGDSLVDNGNNNYLATTARADSSPYGVDYPTPTGRFSNGLNLPDIITLNSVAKNYLLVPTSPLPGSVNIIRMFRQFEYFQEYQRRVTEMVGQQQSQRLVNQALVLITLGGNDFVNNYFLVPLSARSRQFSLPDYCRYLVSEYRKILLRLYELGSRRVLVTSTGPLGCVPAELAMRSRNGECVPEIQQAANIFNPLLVQLIQQLNSQLGSDVFVSANAFSMNMDFISNPQRFGFETAKVACCGQGPYNGLGLCTRLSNLFPKRYVYAFWDSFHPSERANRLIVQQFMILQLLNDPNPGVRQAVTLCIEVCSSLDGAGCRRGQVGQWRTRQRPFTFNEIVLRNRLTALVINGDNFCRLLQQGILQAHGLETVNNGDAAIELIASGAKFDLILIDMLLPILDGLEATRRIRAMGVTCKMMGVHLEASRT